MIDNQLIMDEFGQTLMCKVRDACCREFEKIISGEMRSKSALQLHYRVNMFNNEEIEALKDVVRDSIDSAVHHFLWMIEQSDEYDLIKYLKNKEGFVSLRDSSDGLCGELYTEDGWIEKFSKFPASIK